jgi:hypothetical protein
MACKKIIVCQMCGKETPLTQRFGRQKYCPDCRAERRRIRVRERYEMSKEKRQDEDIRTYDNPEMMALCLNCKRLGCRNGECEAVLKLAKKRKVAHAE